MACILRRVVAESTECGLSAEEKHSLTKRLLDHVAALGEWWPKNYHAGAGL